MSYQRVDVCIIGSGFAGSLLAMMLRRRGHTVAMVEKDRHPRFAIGESSTPLANFKLRQISAKYGLPEIESLSRYDSWKTHHPSLTCGIKRGFAYFAHQSGASFGTGPDHEHELLVTANSSRRVSDLHWLRSDVDAYLVDQARSLGVDFFDLASVQSLVPDAARDTACVSITREGERHDIESKFVVHASGNQRGQDSLRGQRGQDSLLPVREMRTCSRAIFAHFANVRLWAAMLADSGHPTADHPFVCDDSALHHVIDGGWMWQLRFEDDTVSAGLMLDARRFPLDESISVDDEWQKWLAKYPSIAAQFAGAQIVRPAGGLQRTGPLQQPCSQIATSWFARLPAAAGYSDPLYSTGIGHSLFAIERLADAIDRIDDRHAFHQSMVKYDDSLRQEIDLIDRIVSLSYRCGASFDDYVAVTMLYFAAATTCETRTQSTGSNESPPLFLMANDPALLDAIEQAENAVGGPQSLEQVIARGVAPLNHVGLFAPAVPRMYRYTAAE